MLTQLSFPGLPGLYQVISKTECLIWSNLNTFSRRMHSWSKTRARAGGLSKLRKQGGEKSNLCRAAKGLLEIAKALMERGADLTAANGNGLASLNSASDNGHLQVVKLLLENEVDLTTVDRGCWAPLDSTSSNGHLEAVKLLLVNGVDQELIAWLDDRARTGESRKAVGWLTQAELYGALKAEV